MIKGCNASAVGYGLSRMMQMLDMMACGLDSCQRLAPQVRGQPWGMHSINNANSQ